jgi:hypothetical protein
MSISPALPVDALDYCKVGKRDGLKRVEAQPVPSPLNSVFYYLFQLLTELKTQSDQIQKQMASVHLQNAKQYRNALAKGQVAARGSTTTPPGRRSGGCGE